MSSPFGMYGGFKYESPTTRALSSITVESYAKVYDDQAQFMSKLAGDVSFLSGMSRKQQSGIDQANENFIQQGQDMINDIIVLLGGGGDTGFDFGDLRYVIIAIGSLFGFTDDNGQIQIPLNLFQAAWHFFNNYILPVDNFQDAINYIVDNLLATILDFTGEIPIVGQAAEQIAVIISDIRDILNPLFAAVQAFFEAFSIDIGDTGSISSFFGPFAPIVDAIMSALDGIDLPDFSAMFHQIALWTEPFVADIADVIEWAATLIHTIINLPFGSSTIGDVLPQLVQVLAPIMDAINFVVTALNPLIGGITTVVSLFGGGSVPVGTLTSDAPNLLIESLFGPDSVRNNPDWTIDTGSSRTDDGTGSVTVTANGIPKALRSGSSPTDVILVTQGQTVTVSAFVISNSFSGTGLGPAVELQIAPYTEDGLQDFVTIATYTPTVDILDWDDAVELTNDYIIPAGITGIQVRLYISDDAVSGIFHFDDAYVGKTGKIDPSNVTGLSSILQFLQNQVQSILDTVISVISGIPIIGGLVTDLQNALKNIASGNILGIFGGSSIGEDVQSIIDHLISAFTGKPSAGGSVADLHTAAAALTNITGEDETHYFIASGSIIVPAWANYADIVPVGPGQGGEKGQIFGENGQGGDPGKFNPTTWLLNTHFKAGDTISYTIDAVGGAKNGGVGTATSVTTTNTTGTHTISAAAGNVSQAGTNWFGPVTGHGPLGNADDLPNVLVYNGQRYAGGTDQASHGKAGVFPGGGGAGGNGDLFQNGGPGAGAAVWIRFRASNVSNPSSGADTTPPSLPTSVIVSATNDSLEFVISGSVDP